VKGVDLEGLAQGVISDQGQLDVPRIKETFLFREDIFGQKQRNLGKEKHLNMIENTGFNSVSVEVPNRQQYSV
jgi:hypothetical protein